MLFHVPQHTAFSCIKRILRTFFAQSVGFDVIVRIKRQHSHEQRSQIGLLNGVSACSHDVLSKY
jgi:hypothetical protein